MTHPTNTDLADALREIANTLPLGSALVVRLAADRLGAEADGWIEWDGGEHCPVMAGTRTEVRFRDGSVMEDDSPEMWCWTDDCEELSIVAYRIAQ